jgi:pimeloyl-ACP methyl ester carboxylesterase
MGRLSAPRAFKGGGMRKFIFVGIVAVLMASVIVIKTGNVAKASAAPIGEKPQVPKIVWKPCYQELGYPFECAMVNVPLDYDNQGVAAVQIALVRLPATDPARRIGSIFFNPGGPGGSGVDFILGVGPFLYSDEVRARFDLVGFDPRGVGRSTTLRCFGNDKQWSPAITPFPFPVTSGEEAIWASADRFLASACDQRGTHIKDHMSTADVARDLDLLRQAVGDEQITYVGYSYGTYIGITYANLFPDKVRAIVLDGVIDPISWATGRPSDSNFPFTTRLGSGKSAMGVLDEFFRLCDVANSNSPFKGNTKARFATLAANLRANPLTITTPEGLTYTFTYADLIANTMGSLYSSYSWPDLAQFIVGIEALDPPAKLGTKLYSLWQDVGFVNKHGYPHYQNYIETWPGVTCADTNNPHEYSVWSQTAAAADAAGDYFTPVWTWYSSVCVPWTGSQEDRYIGPFEATTAHPVLVTNTMFDPATRYQNALFVADDMPNARLLTIHGWGHTTLFLSYLADMAVSAYLLYGTLPLEGTVYEQDYVPFQPATAVLLSSPSADMKAQMIPAMVPEPVRKAVHKKDK